MRYFIKLSYKGTNYHGWQIQPNAVTVQEELQKCFSLILKQDVSIIGAGRTDTGVHALQFYAHFDINERIHDIDKFIYKINSFLSQDIAIFDVFEVADDVHARFSALSRTYEYRIHQIKDPFLYDSSLRINYMLDFDQMNKAADCLYDYTDFTSFSKLHTDTSTNLCKIFNAEWIERGSENVFVIKADRFLRNMVRAITGTLFEVGKGNLDIRGFKSIIESKDRSLAGVSVPAHGLYLTGIEYPKGIF